MVEKPNTCVKCATPLPAGGPKGGRSPLYCSTECRDLAAHMVRRITARLARLEDRELKLREAIAMGEPGSWGKESLATYKKRLRFIQGEIEVGEQQLKQLVAAGGKPPQQKEV